jgi:uncharacterized membrane protein HdeD (DUF308 family)
MQVLNKIAASPFKVFLGLIAVLGGAFTFLESPTNSIYDATLQTWVLYVFGGIYIIAGICLLMAVFHRRDNVEACGLLLVITSQIVRTILNIYIIGLTLSVNSIATTLVFCLVCGMRLWIILKGRIVV